MSERDAARREPRDHQAQVGGGEGYVSSAHAPSKEPHRIRVVAWGEPFRERMEDAPQQEDGRRASAAVARAIQRVGVISAASITTAGPRVVANCLAIGEG